MSHPKSQLGRRRPIGPCDLASPKSPFPGGQKTYLLHAFLAPFRLVGFMRHVISRFGPKIGPGPVGGDINAERPGASRSDPFWWFAVALFGVPGGYLPRHTSRRSGDGRPRHLARVHLDHRRPDPDQRSLRFDLLRRKRLSCPATPRTGSNRRSVFQSAVSRFRPLCRCSSRPHRRSIPGDSGSAP